MPGGLARFRSLLRGKRNASRYLWAGFLVLLATLPFVAFFLLLDETEDPASSESPGAAALTEAVDLAFPFPTESPSPSPEPEPSPVPTRAAPPPPPPAPAPAPEPEPEPSPEPSPAPSPEPTEVSPPPPPPAPPPDDDDDDPDCSPDAIVPDLDCPGNEPAEENVEEEIEEEVTPSEGQGNGEQGPTDEGTSGE